jgi:hypothetical protein
VAAGTIGRYISEQSEDDCSDEDKCGAHRKKIQRLREGHGGGLPLLRDAIIARKPFSQNPKCVVRRKRCKASIGVDLTLSKYFSALTTIF